MFKISAMSRQPKREAWTMEHLVIECFISLKYLLDVSSIGTYTSTLNSYLTFCNLHHFSVKQTQDMLSFYVVFLSTYIKSDLVHAYLSGICQQLEPFHPEVCHNHNSMLISQTLMHPRWLHENIWDSCQLQNTSFTCKTPLC